MLAKDFAPDSGVISQEEGSSDGFLALSEAAL
jgi:hypothetical protein